MGQASIPILNRNGYTMFWSSLWDNKHLYNRTLKEDMFIRQFILQALNEKVSTSAVFLTKHFFKKYNHFFKKYFSNVLTNTTTSFLSNFLLKLNRVSSLFSKIYIIRYNDWVIIYFYSYSPTLFKSKFKIKARKRQSYLYRYFLKSILYKYNNFKNKHSVF